jgi:hypothetical protein
MGGSTLLKTSCPFETKLEIEPVHYLDTIVGILVVQRRIAQNHRRAYTSALNVLLFRVSLSGHHEHAVDLH